MFERRTSTAAALVTSGRIDLRGFKDALFSALFARTLVYTILFEDNELDLEFLRLRPGDRVLSIAGAGCGMAAMVVAATPLWTVLVG